MRFRLPILTRQQVIMWVFVLGIVSIIFFVLAYAHFFGPPKTEVTTEEFIVEPDQTSTSITQQLYEHGFIISTWAFRIALLEKLPLGEVRPGGYELSKSMDVWSVANALSSKPPLAFVTFPPSIRKEQMGDLLASTFGWNDSQKKEWNTTATSPEPEFTEGVYYPGTYLIPAEQSPTKIAARMRGRFTDMFAPYLIQASQKGLKWLDVLTMASIIDREASQNDRTLVAGILWNRVHAHMLLQADATLQYIQGKKGNWWPPPQAAIKNIDSPFNTYIHIGLPPHPINNPTLDSIAAALNPESTNCIYYLHDTHHQIHCSVTYAGQKSNVTKYLK
jgi:UPF0755 protein